MRKTVLWTIFRFSPVSLVHNVEKQGPKLTSSFVMGPQHWFTIFKHIFKSSHNIFSLIVAALKKVIKNSHRGNALADFAKLR